MDRVVKFRGLRTDGKGWVYGDLLCNWTIPIILSDNDGNEYKVIPETIGQFTGLTDKNGKEIYEGDVFTANEYPFVDNGKPNYNGVVCWVFTGFQYHLTLVNKDKIGISEGINEVLEDGSWIEVIGNIHEK